MPTSNIQRLTHRTLLPGVMAALLVGIATTPSHAESIRSQQWHLTAMKAEVMWKITKGDGVTVAVIDSGVDDENPDLRGQVLEGKDFAPEAPGDQHTDYRDHGTSMAGLIAGTGENRGGDGAFGLAPGARILPVRVPLNATVFPKAIRYAADAGAKVINISMSVGGGAVWEEESEAVKYALRKGALIFAAVGNDGDSTLASPAGTPGVVAVGSVGQDLQKTAESQYGPQVDLAAPGVDMVAACGGKTGLCKTRGTSDATAIASASAALIWSKHPDWTNNQVLRVMLNTAAGPTSGAKRNDYIGYGVVRPRIALRTPGDLGPADEYPLPDLAAAAPSPSPKASEPARDKTEEDEQSAAPAGKDDSDAAFWIGLGVGAAALLGAAIAIPLVRARRRNTTFIDH
ncbi:type VII secretion-associated serine protease mycosin [Streptomyces chartreusis]|uniref:type VII secretion-associated serine protease mycosin n=1 Tax=Streptomyces chartreusis TaxID=1969 RepID=UPI002E8048A3|nr:type VII secretion-associated serine protease mycosin [Streptomyces chartreusis]WUB18353.1 type VII secretion-associated serine protease mycosin [Streptomyces chartreusis]